MTKAPTGRPPRPAPQRPKPRKPAARKAAAPDGAASPGGDRIAKVLSRAGVASRRDAERMIAEGRVAVNGKQIDSPALNVTAADRITVDGAPLAPPDPPRLWLYYKPEGLVTSARDEKGRDTVFDHLPEDMPRVMSIGRLDLNSEGLLLLTNDGELKRRLELPSTGWLRKYRVRVNGTPDDTTFEPLRQGITVDGERFQPMTVTLDRVQGANAWATVGLREGRNREIRRAMAAIGLIVNRLIRVSYGPFRLGEMQPGEVQEVRGRVLRDQLNLDPSAEAAPTPARGGKPGGRKPGAVGARPRGQTAPGPKAPGGAKAAAPAPGAKATPPKAKGGRKATPAQPAADPAAGPRARPGAKPARPPSGGPRRGAAPAGPRTGAPRGRPKPRG